jgi:hypothetical protein
MYSPSLRIAPEQSLEYYGPAHPHSHVRPSIRLDRPIWRRAHWCWASGLAACPYLMSVGGSDAIGRCVLIVRVVEI